MTILRALRQRYLTATACHVIKRSPRTIFNYVTPGNRIGGVDRRLCHVTKTAAHGTTIIRFTWDDTHSILESSCSASSLVSPWPMHPRVSSKEHTAKTNTSPLLAYFASKLIKACGRFQEPIADPTPDIGSTHTTAVVAMDVLQDRSCSHKYWCKVATFVGGLRQATVTNFSWKPVPIYGQWYQTLRTSLDRRLDRHYVFSGCHCIPDVYAYSDTPSFSKLYSMCEAQITSVVHLICQ